MDGSLPCVILSIEALFSSGKPFMYKKDFVGHTYMCACVRSVQNLQSAEHKNVDGYGILSNQIETDN